MTKSIKATPVSKPTVAPASTKDAGKVQIGGAAIRFSASTKDAGKVHIGGAAIRF